MIELIRDRALRDRIVAVWQELWAASEFTDIGDVPTSGSIPYPNLPHSRAVLSLCVKQVYSIELEPALATQAIERLRRLGYTNVVTKQGDGYEGWPDRAPFDRVILTAAPPRIPQALIDQLAPGGILVAPEGDRTSQELVVIKKDRNGQVSRRAVTPVMFVPMRKAA